MDDIEKDFEGNERRKMIMEKELVKRMEKYVKRIRKIVEKEEIERMKMKEIGYEIRYLERYKKEIGKENIIKGKRDLLG